MKSKPKRSWGERTMGNRAVIALGAGQDAIGVYLHWNGGPESVLAFLDAAKELGVRPPGDDAPYFFARFAQLIGNYFGGTASIGVDRLRNLDCDNGDNGLYVLDALGAIAKREHVRSAAIKTVDLLDATMRKKYEDIKAKVIEINAPIFKRAA